MAGGGAERVFLLLAEGLAKLGWSVDLVAADATGPLLADVPEQAALVEFGASHVTSAVLPLARYLRRRRPDAVLSAMTHTNLAAIAAVQLSRTKPYLVVTEHQHLSTYLSGPVSRRGRMFPRLVRLLYPLADEVVAVSNGVADDLAQRTGFPRGSILVENNPIQIDDLKARGSVAPSHPWLADEQVPVVLAIGRLTRQKDFGTLLRAFRIVRDRRDVKLVLLGEGEERPMLEALISDLKLSEDVELPGFVPDPYPYYGAADLFVLSSRWEGLPTVLLEAMVFGLPIVSTDCPSGPDEVLEGGRLGELVAVEDPTALATATLEALPEPGKRHRLQYDALCKYDVSRVAERYSEILEGVPSAVRR